MDTNQVSLEQSNGLLRDAVNQKIQGNLAPILDDIQNFIAEDTTQLESISQLDLVQADQNVMGPAVTRYLGQDSQDDSFWFPRMGENVFQNLRIYRDIIYVKQSRKQRLLSGFKGLLWKGQKNKKDNWAFI